MTLSPLSAEELAQIRTRAEKATQGPWLRVPIAEADECLTLPHDHWDIYYEVVELEEVGPNTFRADVSQPTARNVACASFNEADAAFVAASRSDIPRLLETVAYWQEEATRLKATLDARLVNSGHPPLADTNNSHIVTNWPWFGELDRAAREREANAKKRALSERAQGET